MKGIHLEPLLTGAYILLLIVIATALEWMARHSHKRTDQYHTGGFRFHRDRDMWECPTGVALARAEVDHERGVVRYRAPAHVCNSCVIKSRCTHSDKGREIPVPIDPWLNAASLRFQTGFSLVLLLLSGFLATVELLRHNHGVEAWSMGLLLMAILAITKKTVRRLRTYSARMPTTYSSSIVPPRIKSSNFPAPRWFG
jgi:hypothetical protein